jgi:asparagine synthase (glutamine-hydrolysing)
MCGVVGYADMRMRGAADARILDRMADVIAHRGPDSRGSFLGDHVGLAVRRLSIVDLHTGDQPMENEDGTVVVCCNGEIFNHDVLREELRRAGHRFRTSCDVEVLVHLYEDLGSGLIHRLNGQFSFAIYDRRRHRLVLARDHVGIIPLHYTITDGTLVFGSEIKALLAHPKVSRQVDLTGLDQVLVLPGLVSPRTMFAGISSLPPGHLLMLDSEGLRIEQYWDIEYPSAAELESNSDLDCADDAARLEDTLLRSVEGRMRSDVPHAFYLSGGLDSSLIVAMAATVTPASRPRTYSVIFPDERISEQDYQRLMVERLDTVHTEVPVTPHALLTNLPDVVRHCECPLKESYNVASLRLSRAVHQDGGKVVLTGEGSDELFAGYVGYKFDQFRTARDSTAGPLSAEERLRAVLWGNPHLAYGRDLYKMAQARRALYSPQLAAQLESFSCLTQPLVDPSRLVGRHILHQRSYLDFKLRLADHLLGDHGDRVAMANSVETRYPFLDLNVIECAKNIHPDLMLRDFEEKYILKQVAKNYLPSEIIDREKFAFQANASSDLIRLKGNWIDQYLNPERISREGYFNPQTVQELRRRYADTGFGIDLIMEDDLLMTVITHGIFLETFDLPHL